jgi:hypothetical protein
VHRHVPGSTQIRSGMTTSRENTCSSVHHIGCADN